MIVIVDDELDARELLAEILEHRGFRAVALPSGESCVEMLESDSTVEVVLTDVEMPGMTGLELCGILRDRFPNVIALVMSGRATPSIVDQVRELGARKFFAKPVNLNELGAVLNKFDVECVIVP